MKGTEGGDAREENSKEEWQEKNQTRDEGDKRDAYPSWRNN